MAVKNGSFGVFESDRWLAPQQPRTRINHAILMIEALTWFGSSEAGGYSERCIKVRKVM
jgi:hypothetical protein